jgi:hypothetical protein
MVWSQDLNDPQRRAVEEKLREAAGRIVDDPKVKVYDAMALAAWCRPSRELPWTPGSLASAARSRSMSCWRETSLLASDRPFIADQAPEELIDRIVTAWLEARTRC